MEIIEKLKNADLRGRGGAAFPTWQKWQMVKDALSADGRKFVVCNVSEGEPGVFKDKFILERWPQTVVDGICLAMTAVGAQKGYIYLRRSYFAEFESKLKKIIGIKPIEVFCEPCGYLGGEETTLLEAIENRRCEPRSKPPYPPQIGLFGCPTLINNLETLYYAQKIDKNEYNYCRFYCISGDVNNKGVFEYPVNWTIEKILRQSGNYPEQEFFVQAGGGASGIILLQNELIDPLSGAGAIIVYDKIKTDPKKLMKQWVDFFLAENCGKCVPCREGIFRLCELLEQEKFDRAAADEILLLLREASFCPFGRSGASPFATLIDKIFMPVAE